MTRLGRLEVERKTGDGVAVGGSRWMLPWCPEPDSNRYGLAAEGF
jgi:hypothetical protein